MVLRDGRSPQSPTQIGEQQYPEVTFQTDVEGIFTFLSPTWEECTGFSVSASLHKPLLDFIHPGDRQRHLAATFRLLARQYDGKPWQVRCLEAGKLCSVRDREESFRTMVVTANPIADTQGIISGIQGSLRFCPPSPLPCAISLLPVDTFLEQMTYLAREVCKAADFTEALTLTLRHVCQTMGWDYAEAWVLDPMTAALRLSSAWYASVPELEAFREASERFAAQSVQSRASLQNSLQNSLLEQVRLTCTPCAIADLATSTDPFLRRELALNHRLNAAIALPILEGKSKAQEHCSMAVLLFCCLAPKQTNVEEALGLACSTLDALANALQRKQAETERRRSQRMLLSIMSHLPMMAYRYRCSVVEPLSGTDWTMEFASKGCTALTGYEPEDFIGNQKVSYRDLIHPEDRGFLQRDIQAALEQQRCFKLIYRITTVEGDGKWVWEQGWGVFSAAGDLTAVEGTVEDVTYRLQAVEELYATEMKYRALIARMNEGLLMVGRQGIVEYVSDRLCQMVGYTQQELVGSHEDSLTWDGSDRAIFAEKRTLRQRGVHDRYEIRLRHKSGKPLWVQISGTPILDANGEVTGSLGIVTDITQSKLADEEMRQHEELFRIIFELAPIGMGLNTLEGYFLRVNQAFCQTLDYTQAELQQLTFADITHPDDLAPELAMNQELFRGEIDRFQVEKRYIAQNGRHVPVILQVTLVKDAKGQATHSLCQMLDITERKRAEAALVEAEAKYRSIFENAIEGIFQIAPSGRYLSANPALARIYGYASPAQLMAEVADVHKQLYLDPARRTEFHRLMAEQGRVENYESQVRRQDGSIIWVSENARAVKGDRGTLLYVEGTVEDITERKLAEEQLVYGAYYDALTGLPNRTSLLERLREAIAKGRRHSDATFGLLFIDLDRFKVVNDRLGHLAGDRLLVEIARRLETCIRGRDTVARLAGDEFAILLANVRDREDAETVAQRVQTKLSEPFHLQGHEFFTSASIGIVLSYDPDTCIPYDNLEDLLRDADTAMYRAKHLGRARYEVFDRSMHADVAGSHWDLEIDLRRALDRRELCLYYQPIVSLATGRILSLEALLRWQHPQHGLLLPHQFVPIAEETGLILPLGEWVIDQACRQMQHIQAWRSPNVSDELPRVSVNLAGRQFAQPKIARQIEQILDRTQLKPHHLRLEITEGVLLENLDTVSEKLADLKDLGVQLCIDDFGTGYSSLNRLHRLPIDLLKIDRSFIEQLSRGNGYEGLVKAIANLAENLGMGVIAEGVETLQQLTQLRALGCDYGQGYLFSAPVDITTAERLLRDRQVFDIFDQIVFQEMRDRA